MKDGSSNGATAEWEALLAAEALDEQRGKLLEDGLVYAGVVLEACSCGQQGLLFPDATFTCSWCGLERVPWPRCEAALPPGFRSLAEVLAEPEAVQAAAVVARGIAWGGRVTLLSSREGAGKSTLTRAAAAAVSTGAAFLGAPTTTGRVLILNLEEHEADQARGLVVFRAEPGSVVLAGPIPEPLDALDAAADVLRPVLTVVDSLAALGAAEQVKDAGSSAQWTPIMQRLVGIARRTEAAVVVLHHSKKDEGDYRDSTAIGAAADVVALLQRGADGEAATVRHLRYRKARVPVEDLVLDFAGDRFELVTGEATVGDRVRAFIAVNGGCSLRKLRDGVRARAAEVDGALFALLAAHQVEDRGTGPSKALWLVTPGHGSGHGTPSEANSLKDKGGHGRDTVPDTQACPTLCKRVWDTVAGEDTDA